MFEDAPDDDLVDYDTVPNGPTEDRRVPSSRSVKIFALTVLTVVLVSTGWLIFTGR